MVYVLAKECELQAQGVFEMFCLFYGREVRKFLLSTTWLTSLDWGGLY